MKRGAQLIIGAVALGAGAVALWNVWAFAQPGGSAAPTRAAGPPQPDPATLPPVAPDSTLALAGSLGQAVVPAAEGIGLSPAQAESVGQACAAALPVLAGEGIGEHLARSVAAGGSLNLRLIEARLRKFAESGLSTMPAEARRRWQQATPRDRYAMAIADAAARSPKINWLDVSKIEVRDGAANWDLRDGQSYVTLGSVANRWAPGQPEHQVTVSVPMRLNDGRTGMLAFICAPVSAGENSWVIGSVFVVVDEGRSLPLIGL